MFSQILPVLTRIKDNPHGFIVCTISFESNPACHDLIAYIDYSGCQNDIHNTAGNERVCLVVDKYVYAETSYFLD